MALSLEKKNKKNGGDSKNKGRKTRILTKEKRVKAGRLITLFISNVGATTRGYKRSEAVSEKYSQAKQPQSYAG